MIVLIVTVIGEMEITDVSWTWRIGADLLNML